MATIQPISSEQEQQVRDRVDDLIRTASELLEVDIPLIESHFNLTGRAAGMFCSRYKHRWLRFNSHLFAKFFEENLRHTVAHEVAHYLVDHQFGRRGISPHGKEWQAMMKLLGEEPETTHKFDLDGIPVKRQQRHTYRCGCRDHQLSTTRHNRVQGRQKAQYHCRYCEQVLTYVG